MTLEVLTRHFNEADFPQIQEFFHTTMHIAVFLPLSAFLLTTSRFPFLLPVGNQTTQMKCQCYPVILPGATILASDIIYGYFHTILHFPSPEWQLKTTSSSSFHLRFSVVGTFPLISKANFLSAD